MLDGYVLYTQGSNQHGQLGHGNRTPCSTPTVVEAFMKRSQRGPKQQNKSSKQSKSNRNLKSTNRKKAGGGGGGWGLFNKGGSTKEMEKGERLTNVRGGVRDTNYRGSGSTNSQSGSDGGTSTTHRWPRGTYVVDVACGPNYTIAVVHHVFKGRHSLYSWGRANTPTHGSYEALQGTCAPII